MESLDDEWELSPDNAHPNARRLMKPGFLWDSVDESSPFGNDNGADTLAFFRAWIRSNDEEEEFLDALFAQWDVDRELAEEIPDADLKDRLEDHESDISTYDEVVIAVAFAQLVLEGQTSRQMAALASRSLKRQALPEMIEFRGWSDPAERQERCAQMLQVIELAQR